MCSYSCKYKCIYICNIDAFYWDEFCFDCCWNWLSCWEIRFESSTFISFYTLSNNKICISYEWSEELCVFFPICSCYCCSSISLWCPIRRFYICRYSLQRRWDSLYRRICLFGNISSAFRISFNANYYYYFSFCCIYFLFWFCEWFYVFFLFFRTRNYWSSRSFNNFT